MVIYHQASTETLKLTWFSKSYQTVSCDNRNKIKENIHDICMSLSRHFNMSVTLHGWLEERFVMSLIHSINIWAMKNSARLKLELIYKEKDRIWSNCKNFKHSLPKRLNCLAQFYSESYESYFMTTVNFWSSWITVEWSRMTMADSGC
jgi:hypothetical protein